MSLCTRKTLLSFCLAALLILPGALVHAKEGDETSAPASRHEEQSNPVVNTDNLVEPTGEAADAAPPSNVLYKSVDAKGNITYTDKPPANSASEALKMPSTNTMPMSGSIAPVRRENNQDNDHGEEKKGPVEYTRFEIVSPANDDVMGQDVDMVSINAVLEPGLQEGHTVQLFYNGKPVGNPGDLSFSIEGLERGTYTVEAKIFDQQKRVIKSTQKIQFHVKRHSVLNKAAANNKPVPKPTGGLLGLLGMGRAGVPAPANPVNGFGSPKGAGSMGGNTSASDMGSTSGANSTGGASAARDASR
ncbi:MAG TPA: DUF4124 domain-containing protein [Pseudomonadales bacterium]|nr:DUF4124 domain-containing protein [Pseudomonadales bacterium]